MPAAIQSPSPEVKTPPEKAGATPPAQVPDPDRWGPYRWTAMVVALVQAIQITNLWNDPSVSGPIIDAYDFHIEAARIANGAGSLHRPFFQSPLFPWLLSIPYKLIGIVPRNGLFLQALLTLIIAWEVVALARRLVSDNAAMVAGIAAALFGPLLFFDAELTSAPLDAATALAALLLAIHWDGKSRPREQGLIGLASGVAIAARGTIAPFVLFLGLRPLLAFKGLPRKERAREAAPRMAALAAGVFLGVLPVGVGNWMNCGHFLLSSTNGGLNLWVGNNPDIRASTALRPGHLWDSMLFEPAREGSLTPMSDDAWFRHKAFSWIAHHPLTFVWDLVIKLGDVFNGIEVPRNLNPYGSLAMTSLTKALLWKVPGFRFPCGLLLPLAVLSLIWRWRDSDPKRRTTIHLIAALAILNGIGIAIFFPSGRYRLGLALALIPPAVDGVLLLWRALRGEKLDFVGNSMRYGAAGALAVALWANLAPQLTGPDLDNQGVMLALLSDINGGRWTDAASKIDALIAINPQDADVWRSRAMVRDALGDPDGAARALMYATQLAPDFAHAWQHLGLIRLKQGQMTEAIAALENAVKAGPTHPMAWVQLCKAYFEIQDVDNSVRSCRRATDVNPDDVDGWRFLGASLRTSGQYDEAEKILRHAIEMEPNSTAPRYQLALTLQAEGHQDAARAEARMILSLYPKHHGARKILHEISQDSNDRLDDDADQGSGKSE